MEGKRCSERDILMDLWLNTIYKDDRVRGSDLGPVVYFRNGSGDPLTSCSRMASRWGLSKATACRTIQKFDRLGYLTCLTFSGRHGTVLYLANYLSVMFKIADMPIDKEEVALKLKLRVKVAALAVSVSTRKISVSKTMLLKMLPKILQILSVQGFACCACRKKAAILSPLSGACGGWILEVFCGNRKSADQKVYRFEVRVIDNSG